MSDQDRPVGWLILVSMGNVEIVAIFPGARRDQNDRQRRDTQSADHLG